MRRLQPNVRGINAAVHFQPETKQTIPDDFRVIHIISDNVLNLPLPFFCVHRAGRFLHYVRGAVEFGALATIP